MKVTNQPKYRYKIHNKIYDLTEFVKIHPGGVDMFNNLKPDTNITPMIYSYHKNPKIVLDILPKYEIPMDASIQINYETDYNYYKYCELKKLVFDEICEKKIPIYWSNAEIVYNFFMLFLYILTWGYCFKNSKELSYGWIVLLSFMNTGICNLIFHETSHYAGFKNQKLNKYLTICYFPLMNDNYWKYVHNYLHHCFTNSDHDEDFNYSRHHTILRHSIKQKHNWYNKFQSIYSILLFSFVYFYRGIIKSLKLKTPNFVCSIIFSYNIGFYKTFIWYALCGLMFSFIAQLSHIQSECIEINPENKNDFLYKHVSCSINYKTDDIITRFICFGLDIQIEHHTFPNIPHSSLRKIQHIVRNYCNQNNIPYIEKPSIFPVIYSYLKYLYTMGNS